MTTKIINSINEKQQRIWNWLPPRLKDDPKYQQLVGFIHQRKKYDFFITVNFRQWQPDVVVVQRSSDLIRMINGRLAGKKWRENKRFLSGFAFLERHEKDRGREGSLHVHILGYYPDTFYRRPPLKKLEAKLMEACMKIKTPRGKPMISIGEIDVRPPHDEEGLVRYLSKKLTPENLLERTSLLGPDGLIGWVPGLESSIANRYALNDLYNTNFKVSPVKTVLGP